MGGDGGGEAEMVTTFHTTSTRPIPRYQPKTLGIRTNYCQVDSSNILTSQKSACISYTALCQWERASAPISTIAVYIYVAIFISASSLPPLPLALPLQTTPPLPSVPPVVTVEGVTT